MDRFRAFVTQLLAVALLAAPLAVVPVSAQQPQPAKVLYPTDRTILPIPHPMIPKLTTQDVREAQTPARFQVKAPDGAPNVLIVLIDDMGFGMSDAFGGPVRMPTATRLAATGLKYNQFHTTALCSPTRAALMSGRNHHVVNFGAIAETATAFPGNTGSRPDDVAYLAEMVRLNGYSTAQFGKNHETAAWEVSPSGPTDRWPTRAGFDKFYGFMGGETNQWAPFIYDGMTPVEISKETDYHFSTDMTNKAIEWMQGIKSLTPDKPFYMYYAPGATHAPHHVPKEWIEKYKGKFDGGWDKLREETLARQIKLGVVPAGTKLAPKPPAIKDWDTLSADEKKLFARQMEVFAAFGEHIDSEVGRLVDAIGATGQLDNTLIFYILGDNGTSAEGGMNGLYNEMTYFNGVPETVPDMLKNIDTWGDPTTYPHMAAGWAVAGNTPFQWTKQVASNYGGTRNGMIVHWPKGIKAKNEVRTQWHHVIDVAPTILEAARLPEPKSVNGTVQIPMDGVSMMYSFDNAKSPDRHKTQYFEIFGNRAIYKDGWYAATIHRAPWEGTPRRPMKDDIWELYDMRNDFSLANDLAKQNPAKLKEMQAAFLVEAEKNRVLPIDDRGIERLIPNVAGRPDLMNGRQSLTVYEGMHGMSENVFINAKNMSHNITAEVESPGGAAVNGAILAQAGRFGGWSLYVKDGKPSYTYNYLGLHEYTVSSTQALPAGKVTIRFEFAYDGGGRGKGGVGKIFVNGQEVASGRIDNTQANMFSADEGTDVGLDEGTAVTKAYEIPFKFTGKIHKVTVELKPAAADAAEAEKARRQTAIRMAGAN
ncbi:MAG TPA: arylsulfatase [Pyrinomonadaceae bacterium]|nr:arylsulfatase [Pyrinomonadaceae bacterium]